MLMSLAFGAAVAARGDGFPVPGVFAFFDALVAPVIENDGNF